MVEWLHGFIIPLIKVVFIGGIFGWIAYIIIKAFYNGWSKSLKFALRYKMRKKPYPESSVKWIMECIDKGIGYYDAKKLLLIKGIDENTINETLWIYDQIIIQLNIQKGGMKHGRKFERSNSKNESTAEFPNLK